MIEGSRLVERQNELRQLLESLNDPYCQGLIVSGSPGSGKYELVNEALAVTREHAPITHLLCSTALHSEPFGALAPLLSESESVVINEVSAIRACLKNFRVRLANHPEGTRVVIAVFSGQLMDESTAFVLGQIVQSGLAQVLVVSNMEPTVIAALQVLEAGVQLQSQKLRPLSVQETTQYSERILNARLTTTAARIIHHQTGGNVGLIRILVNALRDQNLLVRHGEYCHIAETRIHPTDGILADFEAIHRWQTASTQKLLERLSVGGTLPNTALSHLMDTGLPDAESSGFIQTDGAHTWCTSELYLALVKHSMPPAHKAILVDQIFQALNISNSINPMHKLVCTAYELGIRIDPSIVFEAAIDALRSNHFEHAMLLGKDMHDEFDDPRAVVVKFCASLGLGEAKTAGALLHSAIEKQQIKGDASSLRRIYDHLEWFSERYPHKQREGNIRDLEDFELPMAEVKESDFPENSLVKQPSFSAYWNGVDLEEVLFKSINRISNARSKYDLWQTIEETEAYSSTQPIELPNISYRLSKLVMDAEVLLTLGRTSMVEEKLDGFSLWSAEEIQYAHGTCEYLRARLILHKGFIRDAHEMLQSTVVSLSMHDPEKVFAAANTLHNTLTRAIGKWDGHAGNNPARAISTLNSSGKVTESSSAESTNKDHGLMEMVFSLLENPEKAEAQSGSFHHDLQNLSDCSPHACELLLILWSTTESKKLADTILKNLLRLIPQGLSQRTDMLRSMFNAVLQKNVAGLQSVADEFHDAGDTMLGIESLAQLMSAQQDLGLEREEGRTVRRIYDWLDDVGGVAWGLPARVLSAKGLTHREKEIVMLVRAGKSNKEISRKLTLSQRTVEGHLYRIFNKLGVRKRAELTISSSRGSEYLRGGVLLR